MDTNKQFIIFASCALLWIASLTSIVHQVETTEKALHAADVITELTAYATDPRTEWHTDEQGERHFNPCMDHATQEIKTLYSCPK